MSDDNNARPSGKEQQQKEWEIGIRAWGPDDEPGEARWEHYHPTAAAEEKAKEKAKKEAQSGINSIVGMQDAFEIYMVEGPYEVDHAE